MNVFDYAMQMEKDGEAYYRELAQKCNDTGLARVLIMLADEEVKHYNLLKQMKTGKAEYSEIPLLANVKNIFAEMQQRGEAFDFATEQVNYYRKAQEIEKKSEDFYREKATEISDSDQKDIFVKIADEEKKHFLILEGIIEFVQRPKTWLEDAEWGNIGKDY